MLSKLKNDLARLENKDKAKQFLRFFKTGKGEYGEGDKFLGISVPEQRSIAKNYLNLSLQDLQKLLQSKIHEHRLTALIILVAKYKKGGQNLKKQVVDLYLKNAKNINNWDLVDLSAPYILGNFLLDKERKILYKLARSKNLWRRRITMLSSFEFIKNNEFKDTLKIARTAMFP